MASLDKLLGKIEKAQSAIKSFKGTVSKFKNLNFNSLVDELAEQKGLANSILDARRSSLQRQLSAKNTSKRACKGLPDENTKDFMYPQDLDFHENYITFKSRPRALQTDSAGTNSGVLGKQADFEVHLYIPDTLLSQANVQYKQESIGGVNRVVTDLLTDPGNVFSNTGKEGMANIGLASAMKFASTLSGGGVEAKAGMAINPMKEMMFEGIGFRSWNFTYEFYPRSNWEAAEINHIIYAFRTAMLPDTFNFDLFEGGNSSAQMFQDQFFNYPNIFDISFNGPIKDRVDGFLPAVCTKCDVDHTGGQKFSVYEDGQPVKSTMTLEFMEIRLMTQNNYQTLSPVSNKGGLLKLKEGGSIIEGDRMTLGDLKNNYTELGTSLKKNIGGFLGDKNMSGENDGGTG
jgi:hypothetical protein